MCDLTAPLILQQQQISTVEMTVVASIIPTPSRNNRILWDQFHSVKYPPAYLPRDNLDIRSDILDWHGDHLLTNFHTLYTFLREKGIYVEILSSPFTCFNASNYGALIIVDSEEEFYPEEITKLEKVHLPQLGFVHSCAECLTKITVYTSMPVSTKTWTNMLMVG